jgi:hypothetical protein
MTEENKSEALDEQPLRRLYSLQRALHAIKSQDGFEWWSQVMLSQVAGRQAKMCEPLSHEVNAAYIQEFEKGEVQGILLSVRMFDLLKARVDDEIEERRSHMTPEELDKEEGRTE